MTEARSKPIVILSLSPEAVAGDRQPKVTLKKSRIRIWMQRETRARGARSAFIAKEPTPASPWPIEARHVAALPRQYRRASTATYPAGAITSVIADKENARENNR